MIENVVFVQGETLSRPARFKRFQSAFNETSDANQAASWVRENSMARANTNLRVKKFTHLHEALGLFLP